MENQGSMNRRRQYVGRQLIEKGLTISLASPENNGKMTQ